MSNIIFDIPKGTRFPEPRHYMKSKYCISTTTYSNIYISKYVQTANDTKTSRKCAVKVIKCYTPEYEIAKKLDHKNILRPLGTYRDDQFQVIYYPWVNNGTLKHWINRRESFSESDVRNLFQQMVNAVNYCHLNDIIHQDLKLDNFLITSKSVVKLTDFGLSIHNSAITRNMFCGSPMYMAPEIMQRQNHGFASDVWSLGICLYELIYGKLPFEHLTSFTALLRYTLKDNIPYPENPKTSEDCRYLLGQLLTLNQHNRIKLEDVLTNSWMHKPSELLMVSEGNSKKFIKLSRTV